MDENGWYELGIDGGFGERRRIGGNECVFKYKSGCIKGGVLWK